MACQPSQDQPLRRQDGFALIAGPARMLEDSRVAGLARAILAIDDRQARLCNGRLPPEARALTFETSLIAKSCTSRFGSAEWRPVHR